MHDILYCDACEGYYSVGAGTCPRCSQVPTQRNTPNNDKSASKSSGPEIQMAQLLDSAGVLYVREHKFHPSRRWRFDFAIIDKKIAIEVEGGVWARGRHTRGSGYIADATKYNQATILGWRVLRYTSDHLAKPDDILNDLCAICAISKN